MNDKLQLDIRHDTVRHRFSATVEDHDCFVEYVQQDDVLRIFSTQVPTAVGNRGIAAALTEHALQYAEAHALSIDPVCPYTAAYLRRRAARG